MTAQILVVDDEPDLERLIQQKFRHQIREGVVSFLFARDGVDALAQLQSNGTIDMVVTDINMPRMDGLSLLQKLQETEGTPSTIIVSAYGVRLHRLWRYHQRRGAARNRQQATRHTHLRELRTGRQGR
jgi:adenylate cyclase